MAVIKVFYANMVEVREKTVYVRGKWISFSREKINETFNLKEEKDGSKFKKLLKDTEYQKIVDKTRPGYPFRVPRVVPPSGVPLYNP